MAQYGLKIADCSVPDPMLGVSGLAEGSTLRCIAYTAAFWAFTIEEDKHLALLGCARNRICYFHMWPKEGIRVQALVRDNN